MTAFDPIKIRSEFPTLDQTVNDKPLVYLDNAATSQKPKAVLGALERYYTRDNANVHRGIHELSRRATVAYEDARIKVAQWINAPDSDELVWTRGTTEAINLITIAWGLDNVGEGDEIIISHIEHHSNIEPWQMLCEEKGAKLKVVPINESGEFLKEPDRKGKAPANPLTDPSQMDGMMGMMKNNMAVIIPNTLIMSWINAFFSGYVISMLKTSTGCCILSFGC